MTNFFKMPFWNGGKKLLKWTKTDLTQQRQFNSMVSYIAEPDWKVSRIPLGFLHTQIILKCTKAFENAVQMD